MAKTRGDAQRAAGRGALLQRHLKDGRFAMTCICCTALRDVATRPWCRCGNVSDRNNRGTPRDRPLGRTTTHIISLIVNILRRRQWSPPDWKAASRRLILHIRSTRTGGVWERTRCFSSALIASQGAPMRGNWPAYCGTGTVTVTRDERKPYD